MFTGEKEIYVDPSGNWEACLIIDQTANFKIFTSTAKDQVNTFELLIACGQFLTLNSEKISFFTNDFK